MSKKRIIEMNEFYHVYNRGVLRMRLFREPADYLKFMLTTSCLKKRYPVQLMAYCLMPNHVHLLLKEIGNTAGARRGNISLFMQGLQASYARYFGIKYRHSGRVFQGVYKSKHIKDDEQLWRTSKYIENNPVRKKMVKTAEEWPYSSASNPNI
jgi:putative transposase